MTAPLPSPVTYCRVPGVGPASDGYSHASRVDAGPLWFIAGQVAVDPQGDLVGSGDFEAQFVQVFANLQRVLDSLGLRFDDIAKFTTYFARVEDVETFMALRAKHFPCWFDGTRFPPNTLCVVGGLAKPGLLFEVEAVACAGRMG